MASRNTSAKAVKGSLPRPANDLRRAYEYLGRVDILEGALAGVHFVHVTALANLAQQRLSAGDASDAAELLRAAEHICFAALAPEDRAGPVEVVSAPLRAAVTRELRRLTLRAEKQWSSSADNPPSESLTGIYNAALEQANVAFNKGAFRPALELVRAAEALSHIAARRRSSVVDTKHTGRLAS
jgi:hypothetical protein